MSGTCDVTPLSAAYTTFVYFEIVMINGVGFATLCLQYPLQRAAQRFLASRSVEAWKVDPLFGLFWTQADASDRTIRLLHLMIAGWLGIAGALQACIHLFACVPDALTRACVLVFFACDLFWLALMARFPDVFKWTHVYGSLFTIACRLPFVAVPRLMHHPAVGAEGGVLLAAPS